MAGITPVMVGNHEGITKMGTVVNFKPPPLNEVMNEFHRLYDIAQTSEKKANNTRIKAGLLLKEMRTRVEAGECGDVTWWEWFEAHSVRSRKDAEKILALVESNDPEAKVEEEHEKQRERMSRARAREKEFPLEPLKKSIGKLTDEQRQELSAWFRSEYGL